MREFFKYVFATIVGVAISGAILFAIALGLFIGLVSTLDDESVSVVDNNTVLYLNLDQQILERTPSDAFANLPIIGTDGEKRIGFYDIIKALKKAKDDDRIECVYVSASMPQAGFATLKEIRDALADFRKSGKKVIAYSEVYTQNAFYVASVADKVYLNPQGALELKGFSSKIMFFKGALDKLGIEAQIVRVGSYKSAVEPFMAEGMSDKNREQVSAYLNGLYNTFLQGIGSARKIAVADLHDMADNYKIQQPSDALSAKLVDGLKYKDEVLDELRTLSGKEKDKDLNTITINEYAKNAKAETGAGKKRVAVIYANGDIMGGEGSNEEIGSERLSRAIRKARTDSMVHAIVLRVNSPGGSALASDVIWREVLLARKVKPVIASFGDVAASGGYYIACAADSIFVQPNTITGSIGVFGVIPNLQNLLNNKLGITFDGVKTGKYADIMSMERPMTSGERLIVQNDVNRVYDSFLSRVAEGRKKSKSYVDSIAGGRVWVGTDAVKIGLADRTGSFNEAIAAAAKKANLKEYRVVEYPEMLSPIKSLMDGGTDKVKAYFAERELGEHYTVYQKLKSALSKTGVQTRLPFHIFIQ
ncbi:signal peptide peptidase SppA [Pedobacter deserti]|uniref:signal peptide peptidase SppA n=1 Tax=Pedobacter deserti TaxID=2817382 RepID=UPI00210E10AF|nr:signal peptide peptidase SppA [Pedobacter sp. SYSU D00382]